MKKYIWLLVALSSSALAECEKVWDVNFGEYKVNKSEQPHEYVTHFKEAAKDAYLLGKKKAMRFALVSQKNVKATDFCKYRSQSGGFRMDIKQTWKYGHMTISKRYPDTSNQDLSIFTNSLRFGGRYYRKGRWYNYITPTKAFYDYAYHYSCGFRVCTFSGKDSFELGVFKHLTLRLPKNR